jgi:lipopolysaccharide biosynthesis glycosyltransferase
VAANTTIIVASDDNAFPGLLVLLSSAAINHLKGRGLAIHLIDCGLSDRNQRLLKESVTALNPSAWFDFRKPDSTKLSGLRVETAGLFTYARLVSAELFPEMERAIYLDTDVVVNRDLSELFDLGLQDMPIGAVQDRYTPVASHPLSILDWQTRGMSAEDLFFNAGVLLIDYKKWRQERIGERALEFARANKEICVRWDQTALNILLYKQWKAVDVRWNYMVHSNITETWDVSDKNFHITGQPKQWDMAPRTNTILQDMFFGYLDQTQMKGWRPWSPNRESKWRLFLQQTFPNAHTRWKNVRAMFPIPSR